ncbi:MAG: tRNA pseudouridine(13) synthase TruD [Gammaproteobacteria bacterium]
MSKHLLSLDDVWLDLPYAWGGPAGQGLLRAEPEDFQVIEEPITLPEGEGEHLWLHIRKRNANTDWVAGRLARIAGVKPFAVSYAGMKDRHAVTTQWFSLHLPGKPDPDWPDTTEEDFEILDSARHTRKLKRGGLKFNRFRLRLREVQGDREHINERLQQLQQGGVPNYFGNQRFGRNGQNLVQALRLFSNPSSRLPRAKKSIYLSAARSAIFNRILAARLEEASWNIPKQGEACQLDAKSACFVADAIDDDIRQRIRTLEIHPTGALWGRGELLAIGEARQFESAIAESLVDYSQGLEKAGLEQMRRALRISLSDLRYQWLNATVLELEFSLFPGSYATTVLREVLDTHERTD